MSQSCAAQSEPLSSIRVASVCGWGRPWCHFYLQGVLQRGVSVVWRTQAPHQAGVKLPAALDEPPRRGQLLLQHFIQHKRSRIKRAKSWKREIHRQEPDLWLYLGFDWMMFITVDHEQLFTTDVMRTFCENLRGRVQLNGNRLVYFLADIFEKKSLITRGFIQDAVYLMSDRRSPKDEGARSHWHRKEQRIKLFLCSDWHRYYHHYYYYHYWTQ